VLYQAYQMLVDSMLPLRIAAAASARQLNSPWAPWPYAPWPGMPDAGLLRYIAAGCEVLTQSRLTHHRPDFGISKITVAGRSVAIREEKVKTLPFCTLLHFAKEAPVRQPRILVVAPLSGHFATLLRGTVQTMLADHDVYVTDWKNARDVPLAECEFGFDDFIDYVIAFLEALGHGTHVVAVCQPAVAVLAAVALMAASSNPAQPPSMTLMAGPIDTRINPTEVNRLATGHPIEWFEANLISRVPFCHPGAFRRVYPGFLQISAFMLMNFDRHVRAQAEHFSSLVADDGATAALHRAFYDEYFAVMDLPAAFYLETVERIFQTQDLARGTLVSRGRPVEPGAIRRTALMTVEGENDDICAVGQTLAAQELCTGLHPSKKRHHLQTGVGHYGVFSGRRWAAEIYPRVRELIWTSN
jgi:poly(3-hydroxybutyrate) depolymerase